jgi:hypothetical protein
MRFRHILKDVRLTQKLPFLQRSYRYEPLPSSTSIRLLELAPSIDSSEIRWSLKTFELHNLPKFSALSYTWGDWQTPVPCAPVGSKRRSSTSRLKTAGDPDADTRVERSVGLRRHPIICDGQILKVTSNLRSALRVLVKSISTQQAQVMPRYYWIDSCCVDVSTVSL